MVSENLAEPKTLTEIFTLAQLISKGASPASWLLDCLPRAVTELELLILEEKLYPKRSDLIGKLSKLRRGLQTALSAFDRSIISMLQHAAGNYDFEIGQEVAALEALSAKVDRAVSRIPRGSSKHKFYPEGTAIPTRLCAQLITRAWLKANKRLAPPGSNSAQKACQQLWELAGGGERPSSSGDGGCERGWRDRIAEANTALEQLRRHSNRRFLLETIFDPNIEYSAQGLFDSYWFGSIDEPMSTKCTMVKPRNFRTLPEARMMTI